MNDLPSLIDVFFVIALLIPGFLAWQLARFVSRRKKEDFTTFDATIYSLAFSLPIIATFSFVTGIQSIDAFRDNLFNPQNLLWLLVLAVVYGLGFAGCVLLYEKFFGSENGEQETEATRKH